MIYHALKSRFCLQVGLVRFYPTNSTWAASGINMTDCIIDIIMPPVFSPLPDQSFGFISEANHVYLYKGVAMIIISYLVVI